MRDDHAGAVVEVVGLQAWFGARQRANGALRLPAPDTPWPVLSLAAGLSAVAGVVAPLLVMHVYDKAIPNAATTTLWALALVLCGVLAADLTIRRIRGAIVDAVAARYEIRLVNELSERAAAASPAALHAVGPGEHQQRVAAVEIVKAFACGSLAGLIIDLPLCVLALAMIATIGGVAVLAPLVAIALFVVPAWLLGHQLRAVITQHQELEGRRWSFVAEALRNAHTTKALGVERSLLRRYERLLDGGGSLHARVAAASGEMRSLGETFAQGSTILMAALSAALVVNGRMTLGELSACLLLSGRALQPILQSFGSWVFLQTAGVAAARIEAGLALPGVRRQAPPSPPIGSAEIVLDGVVAALTDRPEPVLRGLDLRVMRGEAVAILSQDERARRALVDVLGGTLDPLAGRVSVAGGDPRASPLLDRFAGSVVLTAQPWRFDGSLLQHATWFDRLPLTPDYEDLLHELMVAPDIDALPRGWATPVRPGEPQEDLLQRLAIARALAAKPRVIVFADTCNALDRRGDALVLRALARHRGDFALVLMTHRPSYHRVADRVLELVDGRLRPAGEPPPSSGSG